MARRSSGVIARFVGGPMIVFISGRLTTMRGASRFVMSTIETVSFPGALKTVLPPSSQPIFWSLPMIMSSASARATASTVTKVRTRTDAARVSRVRMAASVSGGMACAVGMPQSGCYEASNGRSSGSIDGYVIVVPSTRANGVRWCAWACSAPRMC